MSPVNFANNVLRNLINFTTVKVITVEDKDGALFATDAKPLYEKYEDLTGEKQVPITNIADERVMKFDSFNTACEWCKVRGLNRGRAKIKTHQVKEFKVEAKAEPLKPKGMYFRSTPEMWDRRGIPGVAKGSIVAGMRSTGHKLRMERQRIAAASRRHGDLRSFNTSVAMLS